MSKQPELPEEERQRESRRLLVGRFWASASGFWSARGARAAWLLTVALLALIGLQVFVQYRINVWNRSIFDALQARDSNAVLFQAMIFPALAGASVVLAPTCRSTRTVTYKLGRKRQPPEQTTTPRPLCPPG